MGRALAGGVILWAAAAWAGGGLAAEPLAELTLDYRAPPRIEITAFDALAEEETFSGDFEATVGDRSDPLFAGAEVLCQFDGVAAPGRVFSCGFVTVEEVSGQCTFTAANGDRAVATWYCRTGATMTADARCEGRAQWTTGDGRFAGLAGGARVHADQFLTQGPGYAHWRGDWRPGAAETVATAAEAQ